MTRWLLCTIRPRREVCSLASPLLCCCAPVEVALRELCELFRLNLFILGRSLPATFCQRMKSSGMICMAKVVGVGQKQRVEPRINKSKAMLLGERQKRRRRGHSQLTHDRREYSICWSRALLCFHWTGCGCQEIGSWETTTGRQRRKEEREQERF